MTDGIIQKEIGHLEIHLKNLHYTENSDSELYYAIHIFKQELIEKIKQSGKFMTNQGEHGYAILSIPIYQLIGDLDK